MPHTRWWMCSPPLETLWKGPMPALIRWVIPRTIANVSRNPSDARNSRSLRSLRKWNP
jgi:hypothetical protein